MKESQAARFGDVWGCLGTLGLGEGEGGGKMDMYLMRDTTNGCRYRMKKQLMNVITELQNYLPRKEQLQVSEDIIQNTKKSYYYVVGLFGFGLSVC